MTSFLRYLFVEDIWWKLFALALAMLVWFTVSFISQREPGTEPRVYSNLPVTVVSSGEDVHGFKVSPATVDVTLRADAESLQSLESKDIHVLVDLTGVAMAEDLRERVIVSVPAGITFMRARPAEVQVIFPPER